MAGGYSNRPPPPKVIPVTWNLFRSQCQPRPCGAEMAVEQAHKYITTGSTGLPEKQLVGCELVTPENADCIENSANVC